MTPRDIRDRELWVGCRVAIAVKPGKLVLGTVVPLAVDPNIERLAHNLYVRVESVETGRVIKLAEQVAFLA